MKKLLLTSLAFILSGCSVKLESVPTATPDAAKTGSSSKMKKLGHGIYKFRDGDVVCYSLFDDCISCVVLPEKTK